MFALDKFESVINAQVLQRGYSYFKNKAVEFLEENAQGTWTATVNGTEDYTVELTLSGKNITNQSCNCPYDGGPVCKHVVAVLYALREQAAKPPQKASKKQGKLAFEDILLNTDIEELRNFIRHQKQENRDFGEKFMLFFAEKDPGMDVEGKYESMVRQIVRHNSSRGFMDYRQTFSFSKEIRPVQHAAETALSKKNFLDAFLIGKVMCAEVMQLIQACDDSAANIGDVLSSGIQIFDSIAEAPTVGRELLSQLLDHLEKTLTDKVWFEYGDFGYALLQVAEKTAIKTEPERYLNLLDAMAKIHVGAYSDYKQEDFIIRKIRFYEIIGRPEEANKLIDANLDIVAVRRKEAQKAIATKDLARAKQLIEEGIRVAEGKNHLGTVNSWEEMLLDLARAAKDVTSERYFTKKFAFNQGGIDTKHYQAWKATFSTDEWPLVIEQHIQSVIAEEKTKPRKGIWDSPEHSLFLRLAPVFIQEAQWGRLLKVIPQNPAETHLAKVHPYLSKQYPAEMLAFYLKTLEILGENASSRRDYQHLADLMNMVKKDIEGSQPAIDGYAANLIQKYPRRPAMLEEMRKVVGR